MGKDSEILECLSCGACCRQGSDGRILVPSQDIERWRELGRQDLVEGLVDGHFGEMAFASRPDGSCVHLGSEGRENACSIYAQRGTTCHQFAVDSPQCHEFRRDAGLEPPLADRFVELRRREN